MISPVTEPHTEIVGAPNIYLEEGATLNLTCLVCVLPDDVVVGVDVVDVGANVGALHDSLVCTQFGHIILVYTMPIMNRFTSHS